MIDGRGRTGGIRVGEGGGRIEPYGENGCGEGGGDVVCGGGGDVR